MDYRNNLEQFAGLVREMKLPPNGELLIHAFLQEAEDDYCIEGRLVLAQVSASQIKFNDLRTAMEGRIDQLASDMRLENISGRWSRHKESKVTEFALFGRKKESEK